MLLSWSTIGVAAVVFTIGRWLWNLYLNVFRPSTDFAPYRSANKWAVVTGASEGIGVGYAQQLARRG